MRSTQCTWFPNIYTSVLLGYGDKSQCVIQHPLPILLSIVCFKVSDINYYLELSDEVSWRVCANSHGGFTPRTHCRVTLLKASASVKLKTFIHRKNIVFISPFLIGQGSFSQSDLGASQSTFSICYTISKLSVSRVNKAQFQYWVLYTQQLITIDAIDNLASLRDVWTSYITRICFVMYDVKFTHPSRAPGV